MCDTLPVPPALSVAGMQKLHTWQTTMYAEFLHDVGASSSSKSMERQSCV